MSDQIIWAVIVISLLVISGIGGLYLGSINVITTTTTSTTPIVTTTIPTTSVPTTTTTSVQKLQPRLNVDNPIKPKKSQFGFYFSPDTSNFPITRKLYVQPLGHSPIFVGSTKYHGPPFNFGLVPSILWMKYTVWIEIIDNVGNSGISNMVEIRTY